MDNNHDNAIAEAIESVLDAYHRLELALEASGTYWFDRTGCDDQGALEDLYELRSSLS